jgi:hypothetical protein
MEYVTDIYTSNICCMMTSCIYRIMNLLLFFLKITMSHLPLETCKRLREYWVKTSKQYIVWRRYKNIHIIDTSWDIKQLSILDAQKRNSNIYESYDIYPAPNLEEAIDILPDTIWKRWIEMWKNTVSYVENYYDMDYPHEHWPTLLEAVDKMLNWLIDNNLLPKE